MTGRSSDALELAVPMAWREEDKKVGRSLQGLADERVCLGHVSAGQRGCMRARVRKGWEEKAARLARPRGWC